MDRCGEPIRTKQRDDVGGGGDILKLSYLVVQRLGSRSSVAMVNSTVGAGGRSLVFDRRVK